MQLTGICTNNQKMLYLFIYFYHKLANRGKVFSDLRGLLFVTFSPIQSVVICCSVVADDPIERLILEMLAPYGTLYDRVVNVGLFIMDV